MLFLFVLEELSSHIQIFKKNYSCFQFTRKIIIKYFSIVNTVKHLANIRKHSYFQCRRVTWVIYPKLHRISLRQKFLTHEILSLDHSSL